MGGFKSFKNIKNTGIFDIFESSAGIFDIIESHWGI